jgi:hypothetical protein
VVGVVADAAYSLEVLAFAEDAPIAAPTHDASPNNAAFSVVAGTKYAYTIVLVTHPDDSTMVWIVAQTTHTLGLAAFEPASVEIGTPAHDTCITVALAVDAEAPAEIDARNAGVLRRLAFAVNAIVASTRAGYARFFLAPTEDADAALTKARNAGAATSVYTLHAGKNCS